MSAVGGILVVNRQPYLTALLLFALWWLSPSALGQAESSTPAADDGRIYDTLLLGVQPGISQQELENLLTPLGLTITRQWPRFNLVAARFADSAAAAATSELATAAQVALAAAPQLRYADYDGQVTIADAFVPNDPQFASQWAFDAISSVAGWDITLGDPAIAVAVVDTGLDLTHEDIPSTHVWSNSAEVNGVAGVDDDQNGYVDDVRGWDWSDDDALPQDEHGHGTHVSGVIAAATDNGVGVAGHGRNIKVAALRVLGANGSGTISNLVDGLDYAVSQGFRVVNLSLTVSFDSPALADAVATAADAGVIVVTAAGNQNGPVLWPARYDEALAVAATTADGAKADFSNYGAANDLAAPGADILSTYLDGDYRTLSGTSMATPHVSALAALILSLRPDLTRAQVIDIMTASADDLNGASLPGADVYLGAGEIDMAAALTLATTGLTLTRDRATAAIAAPDATVPVPVLVTAPANRPVINAWVNAQLTDADDVPFGGVQRALTDASGMADVSITTPITPGSYLVRASVGDAVAFLPLQVLSASISVSLTVQQASVTVGAPAVPLTVTIDAGATLTDGISLPLVMATNLGAFANRSAVASFDMTGTVFSGEFYPGTVAGDAIIQAWVGGFPATTTVRIEPGAAAHMTGAITGSTPYYGGDHYVADFTVHDAYGNLAAATMTTFSSSQGTVIPAQAVSAGGVVSTTLDLPTFAHGSATITATASSTLSQTLTIALIEQHFLAPVYVRTVPTQ